MNLQTRINALLGEKGAKPAHLAVAVGATRATVSDWTGGKTKSISPEYLFKVADYFEVQEEWLANGTGVKYRSGSAIQPTITDRTYSDIVPASTESGERNQGCVYVHSYELWRGEVESEIRLMSVPSHWLEANGYTADQLKNIQMPDDSQADRIRKGDLVAVNIEWGGTLKNDTLYAVLIGNKYTLRRTAFQANKSLVLRCRNDQYPDETIEEPDIGTLDILGEFALFFGSFA